MEIKKNCWLEDFEETCQDIIEDAVLLDALAVYAATDSLFMRHGAACFPQVFQRLTAYLAQHALELRRLEGRLGLKGQ